MIDTFSLGETVTVALDPQAAFERFTHGMGDWWLPAYSWSGEALQSISIEPREGGFCTEIGPHGLRCDFGRVLTADPGRHLAFTWQIGADRVPVLDPEAASRVDVHFEPAGDGATRVTLTHSDFDRHGPDGAAYCEAMASQQGWPLLLQRFADA